MIFVILLNHFRLSHKTKKKKSFFFPNVSWVEKHNYVCHIFYCLVPCCIEFTEAIHWQCGWEFCHKELSVGISLSTFLPEVLRILHVTTNIIPSFDLLVVTKSWNLLICGSREEKSSWKLRDSQSSYKEKYVPVLQKSWNFLIIYVTRSEINMPRLLITSI